RTPATAEPPGPRHRSPGSPSGPAQRRTSASSTSPDRPPGWQASPRREWPPSPGSTPAGARPPGRSPARQWAPTPRGGPPAPPRGGAATSPRAPQPPPPPRAGGGGRWRAVGPAPVAGPIHPLDATSVIALGASVWRSDDAGTTWRAVDVPDPAGVGGL